MVIVIDEGPFPPPPRGRCGRCRQVLPASDFAPDRTKRRGFKSWCKSCDAARCRAAYARRLGRAPRPYARRAPG